MKRCWVAVLLGLCLCLFMPSAQASEGEADIHYHGDSYHVAFRSVAIGEYDRFCVTVDGEKAWPYLVGAENAAWISAVFEGEEVKASSYGREDNGERTFYFDDNHTLPEAIYVYSRDDESERYLLWQNPETQAASAEGVDYVPGAARTARSTAYDQARTVAETYGIDLTDGVPLYAPASPQPLNAYMVTHEDCELGIDGDDMYPVSEKGLISQITGHLVEWINEIEAASGRAIHFVRNPDDADILVCAKQSYPYYGEYVNGAMRAAGYSCTVTLSAWQLTNPANTVSFSATRNPESTVSLHRVGKFWKEPPDLEGTEDLQAFADAILGWYGYQTQRGSRGEAVKAVQQALIDRGLLGGSADGSFGPKTEAAIRLLQANYGLEETGVVDRKTVVGLYYDPSAAYAVD